MSSFSRRGSEEFEYEKERAMFHVALRISPVWDSADGCWRFLYDDLTNEQVRAWHAAWKELNKGDR